MASTMYAPSILMPSFLASGSKCVRDRWSMANMNPIKDIHAPGKKNFFLNRISARAGLPREQRRREGSISKFASLVSMAILSFLESSYVNDNMFLLVGPDMCQITTANGYENRTVERSVAALIKDWLTHDAGYNNGLAVSKHSILGQRGSGL